MALLALLSSVSSEKRKEKRSEKRKIDFISAPHFVLSKVCERTFVFPTFGCSIFCLFMFFLLFFVYTWLNISTLLGLLPFSLYSAHVIFTIFDELAQNLFN